MIFKNKRIFVKINPGLIFSMFIFAGFILLMLGNSGFLQPNVEIQNNLNNENEIGIMPKLIPKSSEYKSYASIAIYSDADLVLFCFEEGFSGEGTEEEPFIIENILMDTIGNHRIRVENTRYHVLFRNIKIYAGTVNGILLDMFIMQHLKMLQFLIQPLMVFLANIPKI